MSSPTTSYPTRCLEFLNGDLKLTSRQQSNGTVPAHVPLDIISVGAGLGGLAASIALARRGHNVTILEQATELAEVGAGIQIPSNSARLLLEWGLGPFLGDRVVEPEGMTFRRWEDGSPIGYTKLIPDFRHNFGAPYFVVHRAHFHDAMHKLALNLGVKIITNSKVISFEESKASVQIEGGATYSGDIVVAADGLKSLGRRAVLQEDDKPPVATGFAAYRATVNVEKMNSDPEISWLLQKPSLNIWIGEGRHVMTYTIAGGRSFNMVLSHTDHSDPATWSQETVVQDMRNQFAGWDPKLTKIIGMIEKAIKWPLMSGTPLKSWISPSKKLIIMGDAAHAMVPYMSQGAAMAVEDAAALGEILSSITLKDELPAALETFEQVRMKRSYAMQQASLLNGKIWHFADGPEQRARDASMRPEVEGKHFLSSANQWSDPVTQWWAYGYDAAHEALNAWKERMERDSTRTSKL